MRTTAPGLCVYAHNRITVHITKCHRGPRSGRLRPYNKGMNKTTKMTHDELIAMVMADYTAKVKAEEARCQAIREGRLPKPQPTTVWNISDRH